MPVDKSILPEGPGTGNVRTPFVELRIREQTIPLLDARQVRAYDSSGSGASGIPPQDALLLIDFNYQKSKRLGMGNVVTLRVMDPSWTYLEDLLIQNSNLPVFSFRYGWRGIDDVLATPFTSLVLQDWEVEFQAMRPPILTIMGKDLGMTMNLKVRTDGFRSNQLVSDVIAQLIRDSDPNLIPEVETTSNTVGTEHNLCLNRSPTQYLAHLLRIAKSSRTGRNEYVITTDPQENGQVIVRVGSDAPTRKVDGRYIFGREIRGEMISFTPKYRGVQILEAGGVRASGVYVDPLTKKAKKITSTQTEDDTLAPYRPMSQPDEDARIWEIPYSDPAAAEAFVKRMRSRASQPAYTATAAIYGNTLFEPLNQVVIILLKAGRTSAITRDDIHPTSGAYRIESVTHSITAGVFHTNLELFRESSYEGIDADGNQIAINLTTDPNTGKTQLPVDRLPSTDPTVERELQNRESQKILGAFDLGNILD